MICEWTDQCLDLYILAEISRLGWGQWIKDALLTSKAPLVVDRDHVLACITPIIVVEG